MIKMKPGHERNKAIAGQRLNAVGMGYAAMKYLIHNTPYGVMTQYISPEDWNEQRWFLFSALICSLFIFSIYIVQNQDSGSNREMILNSYKANEAAILSGDLNQCLEAFQRVSDSSSATDQEVTLKILGC
jgi:hypothetical protein